MVRDGQVRRLMRELSLGRPVWLAAHKAGMDEKTARKWRDRPMLPSQSSIAHTWRTRSDPSEDVWPAVEEQLVRNPSYCQLLTRRQKVGGLGLRARRLALNCRNANTT